MGHEEKNHEIYQRIARKKYINLVIRLRKNITKFSKRMEKNLENSYSSCIKRKKNSANLPIRRGDKSGNLPCLYLCETTPSLLLPRKINRSVAGKYPEF